MISKISPVSPSFNGTCQIGKSPRDRDRIARAIETMPEYNRDNLVNALNATKGAIEACTPKNENYTLDVADFDSGDKWDTGVSVKLSKDGKPVISNAIYSCFDGEEACGEDVNIGIANAFHDIVKRVVTKEAPKLEAPKTKQEILDRLA